MSGMVSGPRRGAPPLVLVKSPAGADRGSGAAEPREIDWSILMARAQGGDAAAYRLLLDQITPYVRSLAARRHRDPHDAEDAVQDVLLTVHAVRHTYDPARPFAPWLTSIARHRLIDRLRRQGRLRSRETPLAPEHETFSAGGPNIDQEVSDRRDLAGALESLPEGQRQAIQLLKLKELSLKEAAAATGMSIMSLKVATHRALKNLRKILSSGSQT
jgi:RNA polymerase sigma-70 factor, ECF subfamily